MSVYVIVQGKIENRGLLDQYVAKVIPTMIICGWSADWDTAMRSLIEGCSNRRFTTYWATRSNLSNVATKLATARFRMRSIMISQRVIFTAVLL
jgi:hypothetical protein